MAGETERARALEPLTIVREPGDIVVANSGLNDFDAFGAGGKLYLAQIAKGAGGGRLLVYDWPDQTPILAKGLGELGATGALLLRLARGTNNSLWALIARDTDDPSGERTWTPYDLEIALPAEGTGQTPLPLPPPPGDLSTAILEAIAAVRGPEDGREAKFNQVAGVKNTAQAIYDLVKREAEATQAEILALPAQLPTGIAAATLDIPPRENNSDLPSFLRFGTRLQDDVAYIFTRQDFWQAAILAIREAVRNMKAEGLI